MFTRSFFILSSPVHHAAVCMTCLLTDITLVVIYSKSSAALSVICFYEFSRCVMSRSFYPLNWLSLRIASTPAFRAFIIICLETAATFSIICFKVLPQCVCSGSFFIYFLPVRNWTSVFIAFKSTNTAAICINKKTTAALRVICWFHSSWCVLSCAFSIFGKPVHSASVFMTRLSANTTIVIINNKAATAFCIICRIYSVAWCMTPCSLFKRKPLPLFITRKPASNAFIIAYFNAPAAFRIKRFM